MAQYQGPAWNGRFEQYVVTAEGDEYTILYLADLNNDAMQREGKPPQYYWVPGQVRLARKHGSEDYKFHHTHFVGVENTANGNKKVEGGLLGFTLTTRYPDAAHAKAEELLREKFRGDDDRYWGWRTEVAPQFGPVPISSATTAVSSVAPPGVGTPAGSTPDLDPWAWQLFGAGAGSVTAGENAYSGLIGRYPSEIVWEAFHGNYSPIVVSQDLVLPVWSEALELTIKGQWKRIWDNFSLASEVGAFWFTADAKLQFQKMIFDPGSGITVELKIDGTLPGATEMQQKVDERIDLIFGQFMAAAMKAIFDPAPPAMIPVEAPKESVFSKIFPRFGVGVSLVKQNEIREMNLNYSESRTFRFNQPTTISSNLEGFFNEVEGDPEMEKKYFRRVTLGTKGKTVIRIAKPTLEKSEAHEGWPDSPILAVSANVGYPTKDGSLHWVAHVWDAQETAEHVFEVPRSSKADVNNPPADWEPDVAYVSRHVHMVSPPGLKAGDLGFVDAEWAPDALDVDPEGGTATRDGVVEVGAEGVGRLEIMVTALDILLESSTEFVLVEFRLPGMTPDGQRRPVRSLIWKYANQDQTRLAAFYTGRRDLPPRWEYRTTYTRQKTAKAPGQKWTGPWTPGPGSGQVTLTVALETDPSVVSQIVTRDFDDAELFAPLEAS